jgi:transposase-like protein
MRGKKGEAHLDPHDPPRRRANKRRGRGTFANDRPPIVGTVGRESDQVRIRVVMDTTGATLEAHVHQFTQGGSHLYTDENQSYNHVQRPHTTVCHSDHEWARDEDGDGICEVHVNTTEGLWTDVRNFLRPFKGVHKKYLAGYVAFAEFKRNLKSISPAFIAAIVSLHNPLT